MATRRALAKMRPRRSILYMPGSNSKALAKALSLPADGFILDLEDAVAPNAKVAARKNVLDAVKQGGFGPREVIVRINGLDTEWGKEDLLAVVEAIKGNQAAIDAILVPKVESPEMVNQVLSIGNIDQSTDVSLMCMIETPRGVLNAAPIAASSPFISALVMGTSDLSNELHAAHTPNRAPFWTSLSMCVLAARAHGLYALDGVHLDLNNDQEFVQHCIQGREFGFDGKTLIHPKTIDKANEVFAPTMAQVEKARKIVTCFNEAAAAGKGVVVLDGKLIENLHVAEAKRTLAIFDAIQKMNPKAGAKA